MKVQIKVRVMEGGHRIADAMVIGEDLIAAIAAFTKVLAPHLESDRQIQIVDALGWCEGCQRYHIDLLRVINSFQEMNDAMLNKMREAVHADVARIIQAVTQHEAGGKEGMNN